MTDEISGKIDRLIRDFKLELTIRDKKINDLKNEIDHLHIRLSIHWESSPKLMIKMLNDAKKKSKKQELTNKR